MAEEDDDEFEYSVIQSFKEDGSDAELILYGTADTPKEAWEIIAQEIGEKHE